jgi:hypothetical protein
MENVNCLSSIITIASELDTPRPTEKPRLPERPNVPWVMQEEGEA